MLSLKRQLTLCTSTQLNLELIGSEPENLFKLIHYKFEIKLADYNTRVDYGNGMRSAEGSLRDNGARKSAGCRRCARAPTAAI